MSEIQTPLDDLNLPEECECEFTPYDTPQPTGFEESTHYKRRCHLCGETWYSLHCPHEGPRSCGCDRATVYSTADGVILKRGREVSTPATADASGPTLRIAHIDYERKIVTLELEPSA